jgi:hypothetical protein
VPAAGWIAYVRLRESGLKPILARLPVVLGPLISPAAYLLYLNGAGLDTLDQAYAAGWRSSTHLPWLSVIAFFQHLAQNQALPYEVDNARILLAFILLAFLVLWKLRPPYSIYVAATLGVYMLRYYDQGPQFESMFRYVLALFPCFIAVALVVRRRWLVLPAAGLMLCWQLVLLDHFVHWIWVG